MGLNKFHSFGMGVLFVFCAQSAMSAESLSPWKKKMRDLEQSLQGLLIDLSSESHFNDPKAASSIQADVDRFASQAKGLQSKKGTSPDADPSIQIIASQFADEAGRAAQTLRSGHREYARGILRSMTNYCIACHTRSNGVSFQIAEVPALRTLKGLERGSFLAATRQFDGALDAYNEVLSKKKSEDSPFEWEKALRSSLAIEVRVKKDPDLALKTVQKVLSESYAPSYLKEQATQWKKSLEKWKTEPAMKVDSEEGLYAEALKLFSEAKSLQKFPADRSADILYLRASSVVHDLLGFAPEGKRAPEALYLAGLSYEVLKDMDLGDLHEFYFLACIFKAPQTEISRSCFREYERSVYLGYTGSSGTHLPTDVRKKLRDLNQVSLPVQGQGGAP